jgi:hypothetical protein
MSLQAKLDAFKTDFEAGKPPYSVPRSVIETMHRATAELIASGAAQCALKASDKIPSFVLKDANGNTVSSSELLPQGPLIVSFYRSVWCPYCDMELQASQEALPTVSSLPINSIITRHFIPLPPSAIASLIYTTPTFETASVRMGNETSRRSLPRHRIAELRPAMPFRPVNHLAH